MLDLRILHLRLLYPLGKINHGNVIKGATPHHHKCTIMTFIDIVHVRANI